MRVSARGTAVVKGTCAGLIVGLHFRSNSAAAGGSRLRCLIAAQKPTPKYTCTANKSCLRCRPHSQSPYPTQLMAARALVMATSTPNPLALRSWHQGIHPTLPTKTHLPMRCWPPALTSLARPPSPSAYQTRQLPHCLQALAGRRPGPTGTRKAGP